MMNTNLKKALLLAVLSAAAVAAFAQQVPQQPRRFGGMRNARQGRSAAAQQPAAAEAQPIADQLKDIPKGTNGVPILNFENAPLELVLMQYATLSEKVLLPAPNLPKVQITLTSNGRELDKESYLLAIEATLTMNGVVIEPFDKHFLRAFERKTVRTQGIRTLINVSTNGLPEKGRVVSQLIRLEHMSAEDAQKAAEGFKDPNGLFQVFERNNAILVTDTQENVNRMLEIIKELDVPNPVLEEVFVREVKYALATDIKTYRETIVTESQKDDQKGAATVKSSGSPGFARPTATPQPNRLLNLNNRPGLNKPEPTPSTPNAVLTAAVSDADRGMIRGKVLIVADERSNKLIIITAKTNMDFFDKVISTLDVETTPEVSIEVIRLKYAEAEDVESMLNDLIGAGSSSSQSKNNQNANANRGAATTRSLTTQRPATPRPGAANSPTFQNTNASRLGELNKDNVKVLADKRINGIVVMARKADMRAIKDVIENMDVKLSQVLIETVIIEITLGDDLKTGIDWLQRGRTRASERMVDSNGRALSHMYETATGKYLGIGYEGQNYQNSDNTTISSTGITFVDAMTRGLQRGGLVNNGNYALGGGGNGLANAGSALGQLFTNGTDVAAFGQMAPRGAGVNYFLKSDKLNLSAIIQASKTDSRAKYIASPIVMTVDNKEATIDATENRQFLTGWTSVSGSYAGSSMPSPNYSAKDIGIKIKVTPKINPNGTVMLTVEEEYSRFVEGGQSMLQPVGASYTSVNVDLAVERKMSADVRLENMQTVVFGGLTETSTAESDTGIPILKDIPWIGKWLFGSVSQSESRKELLVFMTPYVLDDEDSAQLEALRRKKALSDPRPWDDHGWSASPLADPVSRKEQLRRFNEEWAKQDEERKTKLAIEKAKMDRAKKLEEMGKEEREEWIKIHKNELEKEQKEAFEQEVKEQKDLREFVEGLKKKDLEKAEKAVREAEAAEVRDNEYNKFIKDRQEKGKTLPAGELLNKDAEVLKRESETPKAAAEVPKAAPETPKTAPEAPKAAEAPKATPAPEAPKPTPEAPKPEASAPVTEDLLGGLMPKTDSTAGK